MKNDKKFPPHFFEPLRRKIAMQFAQKEMRKLLPELRKPSLWQSIDKQVEEWPEKLGMTAFLNGIHGISMGFSSKSLIPLITSLNIKWTEKDLPVEELWFGGKFATVSHLENAESAASVKEQLFQLNNKELLEKTIKVMKEKAENTAPRDDYPIFVVRKEQNKLRVIDGNRRLLQAIINNQNTIKAYIGEPVGEPTFYEHWIPTQILTELVFWHKQQTLAGRDTTDTTAKVIAELIRDTSAGRLEFAEHGVHRDDEIHMKLFKAVKKILADYGLLID
jgi:hypothetical protein